MIDIHSAARALGGHVHGGKIHAPAPNHSKRDRSLIVSFSDKAPDGFSVHGFAGEDWKELKDYVRQKLGIEEWKPTRGRDDNGPVFVARSFEYRGPNGREWHRIDHLSDGTTRPYWWNIDGWSNGMGDKPAIPFDLIDLIDAQEVWLVYGEHNAELLCGGFGVVATTYPTIDIQEPDASFLYHLQGKTVHVLDAGGARGGVFARKFAKALGVPVIKLPDGVRTLREFAKDENADLSALIVSGDFMHESEAPETVVEEPETERRLKATPFLWCDPEAIPPREWLYGNHLIRKYLSITASPGGMGKSSVVVADALAMTSGVQIFRDYGFHEEEPLTVWLWNLEDPQEETTRRVVAAAKHYGIKPEKFVSRLFTDTGREQVLKLAGMIKGDVLIDEAVFEELHDIIVENGIDVVIIDPFVSAHSVNENDNSAIDPIVKRLGKLAGDTNIAIEIIHHVRKASQGVKVVADVNDIRGGGAIVGAVRSARLLTPMDEETAELCNLTPDEAADYFNIFTGKNNMSRMGRDFHWRRRVSVCLNNQTETRKADNVAVIEYYALPDAAANHLDMTHAHELLESILKRDTATRPKADGKRAPDDWLGYKLLGKLGGEIRNKEHLNQVDRFLKKRELDGDIIRREAKGEYGRKIEYYALPWQVEEAPQKRNDPEPDNGDYF